MVSVTSHYLKSRCLVCGRGGGDGTLLCLQPERIDFSLRSKSLVVLSEQENGSDPGAEI